MSYIDDLTYRVLRDSQTSFPVRKQIKFAGFTLVDDSLNDQTIITGNTYGDGYVPDLETVCSVGNSAYSKIINLYDPTADLDAVNLRTLHSHMDELNLHEVLDNGNFTGGIHINLSGGSYIYSGDSSYVGINDMITMYDHRITNMADPIDGQDAVTLNYLTDALGDLTLAEVLSNGNIANMSIDMNNNKITDLALCTNDQDAANKAYVDSKVVTLVSYTAGAGMTQSGTSGTGYTFNIIAGDASITINPDEIHLNYNNTFPLADGTADYGNDYHPARIDHVHPADVIFHPVCRVVCVQNVDLNTPGGVFRGLTIFENNRLLLIGQLDPRENGIYIWHAPDETLTRATDWDGVMDLSMPHVIPCFYASDTQDIDDIEGMVGNYNYADRGGMWMTTTTDASFTVGDEIPIGRLIAPEKNVLHLPCVCATTRNIPFLVSGMDGYITAAVDGYGLAIGDRIFLAKQDNPVENGPWVIVDDGLERPDDWKVGSIIRKNTIHTFPITSGRLWGGPMTWYTSSSTEDVIIGTYDSGTASTWYHVGGADDVLDIEIPGGEVYTFTPDIITDDKRCSIHMSGVIYIGDHVSTAPDMDTIDLPLATEPPYDDDGIAWQGDNGIYLTRQGTPGDYCWRLGDTESGLGTLYTYRAITIPANNRARITVDIAKGTYGTAIFKVGDAPNSDGYEEWTATANAWSHHISDIIAESSVERTIYLTAYIHQATKPSFIFFKNILVEFIPLGIISTRLYLDQEWGPESVAPHYFDADESENQLIDLDSVWGNQKMYSAAYFSNCEFLISSLNINRFLKVSLNYRHYSEIVAAPSLPSI
jgi:hypothetical protein